jgi:hypothetical protein
MDSKRTFVVMQRRCDLLVERDDRELLCDCLVGYHELRFRPSPSGPLQVADVISAID